MWSRFSYLHFTKCWTTQTQKSEGSNYFKYPAWNTLPNWFSKIHRRYSLKHSFNWLYSSLQLLPVPWHDVSPGTQKMMYIELDIPCEVWCKKLAKHHDRAVKNLVLQGETIARLYYLSLSAVITRYISLIPPRSFTDMGMKEATALLMTTLVRLWFLS